MATASVLFCICDSRIQNVSASLRPQDVLILAKLLTYSGGRRPISRMGAELSISASEIHGALKRLEQAHLIANDCRPVLQAVEEFLVHGVKYAFPAEAWRRHARSTDLTRRRAAESDSIVASADLPPVWPYSDGSVRGVSLEPLPIGSRGCTSRSSPLRIAGAHRCDERWQGAGAEAGGRGTEHPHSQPSR